MGVGNAPNFASVNGCALSSKSPPLRKKKKKKTKESNSETNVLPSVHVHSRFRHVDDECDEGLCGGVEQSLGVGGGGRVADKERVGGVGEESLFGQSVGAAARLLRVRDALLGLLEKVGRVRRAGHAHAGPRALV